VAWRLLLPLSEWCLVAANGSALLIGCAGDPKRRGPVALSQFPVNKRVHIRPRLGAEQLRQLRDIGRNPPSLVAGEQRGGRAPAGIVLEIDVAHDCVIADETGIGISVVRGG